MKYLVYISIFPKVRPVKEPHILLSFEVQYRIRFKLLEMCLHVYVSHQHALHHCIADEIHVIMIQKSVKNFEQLEQQFMC